MLVCTSNAYICEAPGETYWALGILFFMSNLRYTWSSFPKFNLSRSSLINSGSYMGGYWPSTRDHFTDKTSIGSSVFGSNFGTFTTIQFSTVRPANILCVLFLHGCGGSNCWGLEYASVRITTASEVSLMECDVNMEKRKAYIWLGSKLLMRKRNVLFPKSWNTSLSPFMANRVWKIWRWAFESDVGGFSMYFFLNCISSLIFWDTVWTGENSKWVKPLIWNPTTTSSTYAFGNFLFSSMMTVALSW